MAAKKERRPVTFLEFFYRHHPTYKLVGHALQAETIGQRLAAVRKVMGFSQELLATKSGVAQSSISKIERGLENLGVRRAEALSKALNIDPETLIWGRK